MWPSTGQCGCSSRTLTARSTPPWRTRPARSTSWGRASAQGTSVPWQELSMVSTRWKRFAYDEVSVGIPIPSVIPRVLQIICPWVAFFDIFFVFLWHWGHYEQKDYLMVSVYCCLWMAMATPENTDKSASPTFLKGIRYLYNIVWLYT